MKRQQDLNGERVERLGEAVATVVMCSVDSDFVALALQRDGGVDDEPLGAADAQVRVDEADLHAHTCVH